jgi:SAM-dependent methyltransferase
MSTALRLPVALVLGLISTLVTLVAAPASAGRQAGLTSAQTTTLRTPDVLFQPTPLEVVRQMLNCADVGKNDVVYDLGSGDGRIVIMAAREYGARGVGIDIDGELVREATEDAKQAGVSDRVRFINQDLFQADFHDATVVTLYLLPALNLKLRPRLLAELKPGTRIVSYTWNMEDWPPNKTIDVGGVNIYSWTIPQKR